MGTAATGHECFPQSKNFEFRWSFTATVHYDPTHPSANSLIEIRATNERHHREATPWIGLEVLSIFFVILEAVLVANENKEKVDLEGTVIQPEQIDFGTEPDGHPGGRKKGREIPHCRQQRSRENSRWSIRFIPIAVRISRPGGSV
jgi:hypothetical protein